MPDEASALRVPEPVRKLTASDLGVEPGVELPPSRAASDLRPSALSLDNPTLLLVKELLRDFGGVILVGPPGTSKTYLAIEIAKSLASNAPECLRFLQFHPSYQYEDFMEGFVPTGTGFQLLPKHLVLMAQSALADPGRTYVLVIDELSRSDPARVFGEALTYVERSKRGLSFQLASGRSLTIPLNLAFICTMNAFDRGVEEVDLAFERRFAKIEMLPDEVLLEHILLRNGVDEGLKARILQFFVWLNRSPNQSVHLGHAYFVTVRDEPSLQRLWRHQLRFHVRRAFALDPNGALEVESAWNRAFPDDQRTSSGRSSTLAPSNTLSE